MHPSALRNGKLFFETYAAMLADASVVDIGAQDVNGSLKDVMPSHLRYTGVDFVEGKGVDVVLDDPYTLPFADESVDIVVSNSCLEHSEMFWPSFLEMLRVLRPTGLLYLNVPSNADFHRYPVDCWRFYLDSGVALVSWARRNGCRRVGQGRAVRPRTLRTHDERDGGISQWPGHRSDGGAQLSAANTGSDQPDLSIQTLALAQVSKGHRQGRLARLTLPARMRSQHRLRRTHLIDMQRRTP